MRWTWFVLFFIASLGLGYAADRWLGFSFTPRVDAQARALAAVDLVDSSGQSMRLTALRGRPVVAVFGYMSCPDVCPTSLAYLAGELQGLGEDRHLIQPVFISVDPARDKPALLAQYVKHFAPDIRALSGSDQGLKDLSKAMGVYFELGPKDPATNNYMVGHSSSFYVLDKDGRLVATLPPPQEKGALTGLMAKIIKGS